MCIGVELGTSHDLLHQLQRGQLDFLIARILVQNEATNLRYEALSEETECAVARAGHPLLARTDLSLHDLAAARWILSPRGNLLRHRFVMMFSAADIAMPSNVVETTAISVITSLLLQTDFLHAMPREVARAFVQSGELAILPIELPCKMDSFGIIVRRDAVLSPGAALLLKQVRATAAALYSGAGIG